MVETNSHGEHEKAGQVPVGEGDRYAEVAPEAGEEHQ